MLIRERQHIFRTTGVIIIMPCDMFGKNTTLINIRDVIYFIDRLTAETPHGKSQWGKKCLSLICFVPLDQIPKIKIFHMVASEHPEVIEGRRRLIATDFLDYED